MHIILHAKCPVFLSNFSRTCDIYNDINNQQHATTFSLIYLFNSALHASGNKFAHSQEHFLTVFAELKRLINEKVVASCWLFTSLY